MRDDSLDVQVRRLLVEGEAEVRELERDVGAELLGGESVENALVLDHDCRRLLRRTDVLTEQRRVRAQPGLVEPAQHRDAFVERLSCDEASRAQPHAVPVDDPAQPPAVGGAENRRAGNRGQRHVDSSLCRSS